MASSTPTPVALVTGASSGIGLATALALLERGWAVYGGARRVDRMGAISDAGGTTIELDVTDEASTTAAVDRILGERGRIDVLVNNAGYGSYGALEDVPLDEARRQFDVNIFGLARLTQLVLPTMRQLGRGRIINISSIGAHIYEPLGSWYHATKFAVEGLSDSLRLELAPHGIDVVIVQPGPVRTEWNTISRESLLEHSGDGAYAGQAQRMYANYTRVDEGPMSASPEDVARTIVTAVTTSRPRSRYAVPFSAGLIVRLRRTLPDRVMDAILSRMA
ncbi:MAG: short-chain dehydrogenase/reductase [Microbacterium sp.]|uniref:oxidoreductase n=1 Tax=unclassified Microbacterium TaxID=2609290 RepID=UPI000C39489C|nr:MULTISPECIES: oxidoreductase [unclassified Microbacterium]MAY50504.1 short-chain dehydrogenase/reductase [Microbacterium sp.]HAS32972.1 short-chain dehydrogenase/reductase [Microbacterium sp.]HBR88823.1 short-chain dehydrogenase/reductase [Microbacterium sp.]HBS73063.1 short-chain dehydrogenase/reductase [Microbacterium sp.]|tara:strand:+ start:26389 stop:27219 length:831 start_codon:yes stop_codon:yes gene_type:complete